MPIGNIVAADATTPTPVNHTFVPIADGNNARYVNEAGAQTLAGQETISFDVNRGVNGKASTVRQTLYDPVEVQSADGVYTVSHSCRLATNGTFDAKSTEQERRNAVKMHINALTAMLDAWSKLQPQI